MANLSLPPLPLMVLNFRRSFWTVRNHVASPERTNERQTVKKFAKIGVGLAVVGAGGLALAADAAPADILTGVESTLTLVKAACVGAAVFFTGFKVVKWFRK